ncbi:FAD/NAD(P)-binding protein [Brevibacterium litoralis]|uniref:FAD/NAD(P)-binding protein n=1 Tax=Brevibacterium litoralis TaxID=3138935 RepID=UPI0032EB2A8D
MNDSSSLSLVVVGAGPRGVVLVDRVGAALEKWAADHADGGDHGGALPDLTLHLVEPTEIGAGAVWLTDQTRTLCMNTLAAAVTLFTEPGATITAPLREGPDMYEWMQMVLESAVDPAHPPRPEALAAIPATHREPFAEFPPDLYDLRCFLGEMADQLPQSHPSRALYGQYIRWALRVHMGHLPANTRVVVHTGAVRSIERGEDVPDRRSRDRVTLTDGRVLETDATVVTGGWVDPAPTPEEQWLADAVAAHPELTWIPPASPVEQDFERVPSGEDVIVRGLGMGFFDAMALVTIDRGGVFEPDPTTRSGLKYIASGREPRLLVSSRRGYPFLPKSDYGGLPPAPVLTRTKAVIARLDAEERSGSGVAAGDEPTTDLGHRYVDFDREIWPHVLADATEAFLRTLARTRPELVTGEVEAGVAAIDSAVTRLVEDRSITAAGREWALMARSLASVTEDRPEARFDPTFLLDPQARHAGDERSFTAWVADHLVDDLHHVDLGADSAWRAGLWEISAARRTCSLAGRGARWLPGTTRRLADISGIGGMAGSGPPAFRTRELLALIDAGLVELLGGHPELDVEIDEEAADGSPAEGTSAASFVVRTGEASEPADRPVCRARTLVDAWMHFPDVRRPGESLWQGLVADGRLRAYTRPVPGHGTITLPSPDVELDTGRAIDAHARVDHRLFLVGLPLVSVQGDAAISPMPGSDPTMLREADRVALALVADLLGGPGASGAGEVIRG